MAYTKALRVSANTLSPWLPEQKCIKKAAWRRKGHSTFGGISKSSFSSLISRGGKEREKTRMTKVIYANLLVLPNKS